MRRQRRRRVFSSARLRRPWRHATGGTTTTTAMTWVEAPLMPPRQRPLPLPQPTLLLLELALEEGCEGVVALSVAVGKAPATTFTRVSSPERPQPTREPISSICGAFSTLIYSPLLPPALVLSLPLRLLLLRCRSSPRRLRRLWQRTRRLRCNGSRRPTHASGDRHRRRLLPILPMPSVAPAPRCMPRSRAMWRSRLILAPTTALPPLLLAVVVTPTAATSTATALPHQQLHRQ